MSGFKTYGQAYKRGVLTALRAIGRARAEERAKVEKEITADWIAAKIRECDGNHDKGAGTIGEYIADAILRGEYREGQP